MSRRRGPDPETRFTDLYRATHVALLAYALRRVSRPADAADVVAEAYAVAWRRIDDVPDGDGARPWLFGVARKVLANTERSAARSSALADRLGTDLADAAAAARPPSAGLDEALAVRSALAGLAPGDREVLLLAGWEGLDHAGLATALGCSRVAARVRLHRARHRFAAALRAEGADHALPTPEGARS